MIIKLLNSISQILTREDSGKLSLRFAADGLMLFRGLRKLFTGIDGISDVLIAGGLPGFVAYSVLLGRAAAPYLVILSILTHPAALGLASTMVVTRLMAEMGKTWTLDKTGVWMTENLAYLFIGAPAVVFLGAGCYSVAGSSAWRWLPSESQHRSRKI